MGGENRYLCNYTSKLIYSRGVGYNKNKFRRI
jgi:hypothetical protein